MISISKQQNIDLDPFHFLKKIFIANIICIYVIYIIKHNYRYIGNKFNNSKNIVYNILYFFINLDFTFNFS